MAGGEFVIVIPAKAGIQNLRASARIRFMSPQTRLCVWVPAFAGMTAGYFFSP